MNLRDYIKNIPKAELHLHLDSIPAELLLSLAKRNGVELPFETKDQFKDWYVLEDLQDFMEKYVLIASVLQNEEDYSDLVQDFGRRAAAQNILRCELMFTYAAAHEGRIELSAVMNGLKQGRLAAKEKFDVDICFLADIDRAIDPARSIGYIEDILPYADDVGILGVGFDCQEYGYPAGPHKPAFDLARDNGLYISAHAGEEFISGPEAIWEVIENIAPDRLDHGNQAIRDNKLIDYLAETQLPLTMCPMSNVAIQAYSDISEHPAMRMIERGVFVTVNSDDVTMLRSENDLVYNYQCLADAFDLNHKQIADLARRSFLASYASDLDKRIYLSRLDKWLETNLP
jgi:adenine deaminase